MLHCIGKLVYSNKTQPSEYVGIHIIDYDSFIIVKEIKPFTLTRYISTKPSA